MPDTISIQSMPWQPSREPEKVAENNQRLKQACCELESLFIYQLLKEMRATIPDSGLTNSGMAKEIYTSMMDSQLAKEISSERGMGLSKVIYDQLIERNK